MDLELPGMSGIEATRRLKATEPGVPVVVLTVFEEPATILDAIAAGIDGYLLKKSPAVELIAQLKTILAGGAPLNSGIDTPKTIGTFYGHATTVFDFTTQYNPYRSTTEKYGVSFRYTPEVAKVLNASYRFQTATLRQIDISGQWPIGGGWYGVGRYNYSILDDRLVEGLAGAEYNAGCWVFRFVMQKLQASAQVTSTALVFQIEFTGVGQIGTAEAVQLLRRDVPGYSVLNRTEPSLATPTSRSRLPFEQVF
jgi:hypothetical protein